MKSRILIIIFSLVASVLYAQTATVKKGIWDYPVKPGMEEWKTFTSGLQRLEACQIPQKILETLSTRDLAEICLNYPLFHEYGLIEDERAGISIMIEMFNGLKKLSERKDGAQELIQIYKDFPVLSLNQQESSNDYNVIKLPFLELLLSDNLFLNQLGEQQLVALEKVVLAKYERKLENIQVYSLINIRKTFLLGAVVMDQRRKFTDSSKQQDAIKRFIENYRHAEPALLSEISKIISEI